MRLRGTRMKLSTVAATLAAATFALGLSACTQKQDADPPAAAAPTEVTVTPPAVNGTTRPAAARRPDQSPGPPAGRERAHAARRGQHDERVDHHHDLARSGHRRPGV